MVTCQEIERELLVITAPMTDGQLVHFAKSMGVDTKELEDREEIIGACITLELNCFTH